jgi:hypothetical protein
MLCPYVQIIKHSFALSTLPARLSKLSETAPHRSKDASGEKEAPAWAMKFVEDNHLTLSTGLADGAFTEILEQDGNSTV